MATYRLKIAREARNTIVDFPRSLLVKVQAWLVDLAKDQSGHQFEPVVSLQIKATSVLFLDEPEPWMTRRVSFFFDFDEADLVLTLVSCRLDSP